MKSLMIARMYTFVCSVFLSGFTVLTVGPGWRNWQDLDAAICMPPVPPSVLDRVGEVVTCCLLVGGVVLLLTLPERWSRHGSNIAPGTLVLWGEALMALEYVALLFSLGSSPIPLYIALALQAGTALAIAASFLGWLGERA